MKYQQLGATELKISQICLGTMTWGEQNTLTEAHDQLDFAIERGVNFIDTAEMYPVPPRPETYSETEKIIGQWSPLQQKREQIILASKVIGPMKNTPHIRDGQHRLDRKNILAALDASLKRLKTDYIDLYQIHWPQRRTNFFGKLFYQHSPEHDGVPIEETLETLAEIQASGKVRYFGLSNETAWGTMQYLKLAQQKNWPRIASIQNPYNLLNRSFEVSLSEISLREKVSLLAYSPLAFGVLTGKYLGGRQPTGARLSLFEGYQRYSSEQALAATESYVNIARKWELDPAQMALAFVNSRDFCDSTIIGATSLQQLKANIESVDLELSDEVIAQIEQVHTRYPLPSP